MNDANTPETGDIKQAGAKAKEAAGAATEDMKAYAKDVADGVTAEAGDYARQAKGTAADEVKSVSSALRTAADELRRGSPQQRAFSQIADGLADASDALRDKDLGEMAQSIKGFAQRNPLVFLGGAALVGFAATRFATASGHRGTGSGSTPPRSAGTSTGAAAPRTGAAGAPGGTSGLGGISGPVHSTDHAGGLK